MKKCRRCNILKSLGDFYKHKQMHNGHLNFCKDCKRKEAINTRNKRIEYYREYDSKRYYTDEKRRESCFNSNKIIDKEKKRLAQIEWRSRNKLKTRAHNMVKRNLNNGKIKKPKVCYCCKEKTALVAHHEDYNFPLFIHWVCKPCHGAIHKLEPF